MSITVQAGGGTSKVHSLKGGVLRRSRIKIEVKARERKVSREEGWPSSDVTEGKNL